MKWDKEKWKRWAGTALEVLVLLIVIAIILGSMISSAYLSWQVFFGG